ncbi:MAG: histidine phosphatase family protein [Lachnospiraceae bacterium]|nr:histidine phosphatase family protein [Lachnospiraceae bacterium]
MKILMIRHGRTSGNLRRAYIGMRSDEPILPGEKDRAQKRKAFLPEAVDQICISPMLRCRETARAFFENVPLTPVAGFREMDFGEFEGKTYQDLQENAAYQAYIDSGGETAFPGGESRAEFEARVKDAALPVFRELMHKSGGDRPVPGPDSAAVFVVHGGTIMALLDTFSEPHEEYFHWQVACLDGFMGTLTAGDGTFSIREVKEWPFPKC